LELGSDTYEIKNHRSVGIYGTTVRFVLDLQLLIRLSTSVTKLLSTAQPTHKVRRYNTCVTKRLTEYTTLIQHLEHGFRCLRRINSGVMSDCPSIHPSSEQMAYSICHSSGRGRTEVTSRTL